MLKLNIIFKIWMSAILVLADGPKSSVRPLDGLTSLLKFEVDLLSGSKDIAFTRGVYSLRIKKFDGSHLDFCTLPKINSVRHIG